MTRTENQHDNRMAKMYVSWWEWACHGNWTTSSFSTAQTFNFQSKTVCHKAQYYSGCMLSTYPDDFFLIPCPVHSWLSFGRGSYSVPYLHWFHQVWSQPCQHLFISIGHHREWQGMSLESNCPHPGPEINRTSSQKLWRWKDYVPSI